MATNYACQTGCDADNLPEVSFNDDCDGSFVASELQHLYMGKPTAAAFADVTDPTEWAARLSQTDIVGDKIRKLTGIGSKDASSPVTVQVSKRREVDLDATHSLTFDIDDVSDLNYKMAQKFQCGKMVRIWWENLGKKLFGDDTGVLAYCRAQIVHGRGDEVLKIILTFTWRGKQDPGMITSPL